MSRTLACQCLPLDGVEPAYCALYLDSRLQEVDPAEPEMDDTDLDGDLTQMDFLKRQEVWLKRRQNSVDNKVKEVRTTDYNTHY